MRGGEARGCPPADRLSAFIDGDLSGADTHSVRAHVDGCAACQRAAADLRALVGAARALDRPEPPPTLWPVIEGELDRREQSFLRLGFRWWPFGAGALAGASAAIAVVLLLGARTRDQARDHARGAAAQAGSPIAAAAPVDPMLEEAEAEFARAAADYERSIEKLRALLERETTRWTSDERTRYAERLARLDDAIVRSREAARRSPGDSAGNELLFAAYQQKIAFLAAAVHRGGAFGEPVP
jgi:hypothetical protein